MKASCQPLIDKQPIAALWAGHQGCRVSTLQCLSSGSTQAGAVEGRQVCKQIINRRCGKGAGKRADEQRGGRKNSACEMLSRGSAVYNEPEEPSSVGRLCRRPSLRGKKSGWIGRKARAKGAQDVLRKEVW